VYLPNKRVQSDAAVAARISARNWLCNVLRIEAHFGKNAARLTRRALGRIHSIWISKMPNNFLVILSFFVLFGVTGLLAMIEAIQSGTWNKRYFTTGLLIFSKRIPTESQHNDIPSYSQLERRFHSSSNWTRSLAFRPIAANTYGFRHEALFEFRPTRISQLMHGMLFFDSENSEVVVKGFAPWSAVCFPLLGFGVLAYQVVFVRGSAPLSAVAILGAAAILFALVLGSLYRAEHSRFSNVATFASQAWSREYLEDADAA